MANLSFFENEISNFAPMDDQRMSLLLAMLTEQKLDIGLKHNRRTIFEMLSKSLACKITEICIVEHLPTTKDGVKYTGAFFYFEYSPPTNALLKTTDHAFFSKPKTAWRLCIDHSETDMTQVKQDLYHHFNFIVDLDKATVYTNSGTVIESTPVVAFKPLPFHVRVYVDEVFSIMQAERKEIQRDTYIYVWDETFVRMDKLPSRNLNTRFPFLLLRVQTNAQPRYFAYSVLGKSIDKVTFGPSSKDTKQLIARYAHAIEYSGVEGAILNLGEDGYIEKTDELVKSCHGEFDQRFKKSFEVLSKCFEDMKIFPLLSSYVTTWGYGLGADCGVYNDTVAYVYTLSPEDDKHNLYKIASFFGATEGCWPVVFSESYMGSISDIGESSDDKTIPMLDLLVHEAAHWVHATHSVFEQYPQFNRSPHDVCWAVIHELMARHLNKHKTPADGDFSLYHNDDDWDSTRSESIRAAIDFVMGRVEFEEDDVLYGSHYSPRTTSEIVTISLQVLKLVQYNIREACLRQSKPQA